VQRAAEKQRRGGVAVGDLRRHRPTARLGALELRREATPFQQRAELQSTNPLERLNGGDRRSARGRIKRRTEVVGIFPNEAAITPLAMAG
jgi:hypothetical protein